MNSSVQESGISRFVNRYWRLLFVLPMAILYLIFFMYPLIQGIFISFTNWDGLSKVKRFIGLKNYIGPI